MRDLRKISVVSLALALAWLGGGSGVAKAAEKGSFKTTNANYTPVTVNSVMLFKDQATVPFSSTLQAKGGTPSYSWQLSGGTLPPGITLSAAGVLSGTPTTPGVFSFTMRMSDSGNPVQTKSIIGAFAVTPSPLTINSAGLPGAVEGSAYATTLQSNGGQAAYTWSLKSGSLPAGLQLASDGVISGTPTSTGTASFTVQLKDSGMPVQTKTASESITVATPLAIGAFNLAAGQDGAAYSASLQASGGSPSYSWSLKSGSLPTGLSLSSAGVISGTPTTAGTANFTVQVSDNGSPEQTQTAAGSLTVKAAALSVSTTALNAGTKGSAYTATLQATGGVTGYTWSVASGSLPAGLSLAPSGVLSGTPTAASSSSFVVKVSDNESPAQTATKTLALSIAAGTSNSSTGTTAAVSGPGTTWYIRPDGGTRFSTNNPQGQCDGKGDAAYSGDGGYNEHCAFNDYRFLWDDQHTYGKTAWVIAGGDTVLLEGGPWRVGFDQGTSANDKWCWGGNGPYSCTNPTIPAGTASQPTRILGQNYASCRTGNDSNKAQMTQIYGGYGLNTPLNLDGANNVQIECIEVTRHSDCVTHGSPALPRSCSSQYPIDDYDSDGIQTDVNTANVLLQDMWIHGHTDRGIIGPIGGLVTANRVNIDTNGMAGWDLDDGWGTPSPNGQLVMNYSIIQWSGCNQEYPFVDAVPVASCYSQSTGGYGDGIGTPVSPMTSVSIDHSTFRYNTQDGEDFGHVSSAESLTITNSVSYANSGGQFKWAGFQNVTFTGNVALANCLRLSQPLPGAPSSYNANLSDFCRAEDALSFDFNNNATALLANNTIVTYAPTTFDVQCYDGTSCTNTTINMANNIVLAYNNPTTWNMGGQASGPGGFCGAGCNGSTLPIGTLNRYNNLYFGLRGSCVANQPTIASRGTMSGEVCANPAFVNQPSSFIDEATLDDFNVTLSSSSPDIYGGVPVTGLVTDLLGSLFHTPPSLGAIESGNNFSIPAPTQTPF